MKSRNGVYRSGEERIGALGKQADIELTSWDRFHTRNLAVAPDLLGEAHTFTFDERDVTISLPSAGRLTGFETGDGRFVDDRLSVSGWRTQDGLRHPLEVHVHDVDVVVSIPSRISVPEEVLTRHITAYELFSDWQQKSLNKLASDCGSLASRAFDLWIRTIRWKVDSWRIGSPEVSGAETGWSTYLKEKNTQKDLWAADMVFVVSAEKAVTPRVWDDIAVALHSGQAPPIYYDLLYDAMIHLDREDLRRAVVDAAVAAETYMKTAVQEGLPPDLDEHLQTYISKANVSQVRSKFFPARLDDQQRRAYKVLSSDLHKLFEDRNKIMHSGQREGLTTQYCRKLIDCVRALLDLVP